ncbi:MAG: TetR/AcrR family transcriptional regulator [Candidatus Dormibacteraceae bacterium]
MAGISRATYRHGDLHNALVAAGLELAREGGPGAIVLREATRQVGVAPNAAYRHFADRRALRSAVSAAARVLVAEAMTAEQQALPPLSDPRELARARMLAVGTAYLRFAQAEAGWFRTAFTVPDRVIESPEAGKPSPFLVLVDALDAMVDVGAMPPERRPGAEIAAWSAVHGLAMLVLEGPLRRLDAEQRRVAARRVLAMVERGI